MRFLDNTSVLKIEDILPFFPDFVVIDDFKEEICTALEGYSSHIESLKAEMDDATRNAESIKRDIADLKNKFVTLEENEICSHCDTLLLTRQFYVFPCQHTFHADCLIGLVSITPLRISFGLSLTPCVWLYSFTGQGIFPITYSSQDYCSSK